LYLCPAILLAQALFVAWLRDAWLAVQLRRGYGTRRTLITSAAIVVVFLISLATAWRTTVPRVGGFEALTRYLMDQPNDGAFFYDGKYHGTFVCYVWMSDCERRHRVAVGHKTVYAYARSVGWKSQYYAESPEDVLRILRRNGCRWIVIENGDYAATDQGARLIRAAAALPDMQFVQRFALDVVGVDNIESLDLYRLSGDLEEPEWIDLPFPILGPEEVYRVRPISPRTCNERSWWF
jgi:hypothetical protein